MGLDEECGSACAGLKDTKDTHIQIGNVAFVALSELEVGVREAVVRPRTAMGAVDDFAGSG
jgi:hypothetical protein